MKGRHEEKTSALDLISNIWEKPCRPANTTPTLKEVSEKMTGKKKKNQLWKNCPGTLWRVFQSVTWGRYQERCVVNKLGRMCRILWVLSQPKMWGKTVATGILSQSAVINNYYSGMRVQSFKKPTNEMNSQRLQSSQCKSDPVVLSAVAAKTKKAARSSRLPLPSGGICRATQEDVWTSLRNCGSAKNGRVNCYAALAAPHIVSHCGLFVFVRS